MITSSKGGEDVFINVTDFVLESQDLLNDSKKVN